VNSNNPWTPGLNLATNLNMDRGYNHSPPLVAIKQNERSVGVRIEVAITILHSVSKHPCSGVPVPTKILRNIARRKHHLDRISG
jgi:hypothetical protein